MTKFFRNLFSGFFFVLLALLLELGIIIFLQYYLDDYLINKGIASSDEQVQFISIIIYLLLRFAAFIFALIVFFKIITKMEDPEFKIPWIVGMLILPLFVSIMFIIFGNHGLRKKDRIINNATRRAYREHFELEEDIQKQYVDELGEAVGTFKYIKRSTRLGAHKNNKVTYFKNGEEFFPDFFESLRNAKQFIFIEFFIISDGKLWDETLEILKERAQNGVDVRIVYDDMGCSGTISPRTPKILKEYGINCHKFHPFRPILSGVYNNRDHRKIVIVDHTCAYTGGMNLADEYANINSRFGYWKDSMIKIEGSAISNLISIFLQNYNLCIEEVSNYNKYLNYEYPKFEDEGFVMPFGDGPGGIDDALIGEQTYVNILHYAKKEVFISTPYLVPTYQLIDAMRNAALRGVKVHLILPGIPDKKAVYRIAKSNFRYLLDAGVDIYLYTPGFNHMKTMLADDSLAFVGTINFDFRSLVHHFECGSLLYKCPCISDIKADFEEMLSKSEKVNKNFKLSLGTRLFCTLLKLFTPLL